MLRPELPGGILRPGPEDADGIAPEGGVELVHHLPGPFPSLTVQLAPEGRLPDGFGQQLRNHHAAFRVAEAVPPEPFAQAHGQGDHFPGVVGRFREPGRGSVRIERIVVEGARVHEDEDVLCGHLVAAHLLRRSGGIACDGLPHRLPGGDRSAEAAGDGDSLPGRLHQFQRQAGDATQLVDGAATRHGHQRPRIVRVECREIGGRLDSQPGELRRRGSTDSPDLIDGHRGQQLRTELKRNADRRHRDTADVSWQ